MDSLGNRMKQNYELPYRQVLPRRMPVIIRLDGKAFHTFTNGMDKPFDSYFISAMHCLTRYLVENIQTAVYGYTQSDEISILLINYKRFNSEPWFDNEVQKMVSISAAMATRYFCTKFYPDPNVNAIFDSRVFVLPESEVNNYFVWRQKDWIRNSLQMLARSLYSHNECLHQNSAALHQMCFDAGHNWNDLPIHLRRGTAVKLTEFGGIYDFPDFARDREEIQGILESVEK